MLPRRLLPVLLVAAAPCLVSSQVNCRTQDDSAASSCNTSVVSLPYTCFPETWCDAGNGTVGRWYTGDAGCDNWVCSLRVNCGCFAGETGGVGLQGCQDLVDMFFADGCRWADYFPCLHELAYKDALMDCGLSRAPSTYGSPSLLATLSALLLTAAVASGDDRLFR